MNGAVDTGMQSPSWGWLWWRSLLNTRKEWVDTVAAVAVASVDLAFEDPVDHVQGPDLL